MIDRAFRPAIRAIETHDGSIQSFGSDAIFAIFPGRSAVRRALIAGHCPEVMARLDEDGTLGQEAPSASPDL